MNEQITIEPPDVEKENKTQVNLILNEYTDESGIMIDGKMISGVAGIEIITLAVIHLIDGSDINLNFRQQIHTVRMWLDDHQLLTLMESAEKASEKE